MSYDILTTLIDAILGEGNYIVQTEYVYYDIQKNKIFIDDYSLTKHLDPNILALGYL